MVPLSRMMPIPPKFREIQTLGKINYEFNGNDFKDTLNSDTSYALLSLPAISGYESECKLFKDALIDTFWYTESGFDIDEQFIAKFHSRWATYAPIYARNLHVLYTNEMFDRLRSGMDVRQLGDGYTMTQKTAARTDYEGEDSTSDTKHTERKDELKTDSTDTREENTTVSESNDNTQNAQSQQFAANISESQSEGASTRNGQNTLDGKDVHTQTDTATRGQTDTGERQNASKWGRDNNTNVQTYRQNEGKITDSHAETITNYDVEKIREIPKLAIILDDFINKFRTLFMQVYTEM